MRKDSNGADVRYSTLQDYTQDVCASCYNYIQPSGLKMIKVWNERKKEYTRERPLYYYAAPDTGYLYKKPEPNGTLKWLIADPEKLNRDEPENDEILRTFATEFHLVSLI